MNHILKYLSLTLLALFTICCIPGTAARNPASIQHFKDGTVAFVLRTNESAHIYCGGFFISDQEILTANHCARAALRYSLSRLGNEEEAAVLGLITSLEDPVGINMEF